MISTGIDKRLISDYALSQNFLFCFISLFIKPNQKDLADLFKSLKLWVKHQTRINYSHCCSQLFI